MAVNVKRMQRIDLEYLLSLTASTEESTIHRAMTTIMDSTKVHGKACITFKPRTNEVAYVRYQGGSG